MQSNSVEPVTSGLVYTTLFIFPSFIWKPLHIWFSTRNKGASYLTYLLSVLWWEVGHWKQIPLGYVAVLEVDEPHWACHWQMWHVLSVSTLLSLLVASWGHCPKWALCFMHFPGLRQSGTQVLGKGTDHDWLCALCFPQVQNLRWMCGRQQATVPGGPCILCHCLVSAIQFSACARGHSLRCAMCLLRVANPRLLWSWPMWTVHELRNSSLAPGNQLRAWKGMSLGPRYQ